MAGTANGLIDDLPTGLFDYPKSGTLFDLLDRNNISWANYHHVSSSKTLLKRLLGGHVLSFIRKLEHLFLNMVPTLQKTLERNIQFTADLYPLGLLRCLSHIRDIDRFWTDAAKGTLPAVSIVDPDFSSCSEENPQDILAGERFAAKVIHAVMTGDGWPNTLLVWLYDEHGGYFDHLPPPSAVEPDGIPGQSLLDAKGLWRWLLDILGVRKRIENIDAGPTAYDRLGFRVPAVVVSPYARPGYVSSTVYDHTSILKLIERKWNLPPLTRRDAFANDPLDMLDLSGAPAFLNPPPLPSGAAHR
jgi:phospholipase C